MAEEAAAAAAAGGEVKKSGSGIAGVLAGSLLSGALLLGGMAYLMQAQNKAIKDTLEAAAKRAPEPAGAGAGAGAEAKGGGESAFFDLDEFLVNLNNNGGGRYLRTTISLRFHNPAAADAIKKALPQVRDAIIEVLTSHSTQELATASGKARLKDELLARVTRVNPEAGFDGVFLQSFTVQ